MKFLYSKHGYKKGLKGKVWRDVFIIIFVCLLIAIIAMEAKASVPRGLVSPIPYETIIEIEPEIAKLTPEQEQDWESMKRMAKKLAPIYEFPEKVIIAQMALESARGTSHFCVTRHNCFGLGAYDSNPDNAFVYGNKEQAIIAYMRLIQADYKRAYQARNNPDLMIKYIHEGGYATDPNYVVKIKKLPEWNEEI